ncbi:hypothetical protein SAMN05892883_3085 [Jatrophihabitans sp. GAS493]|nr:hypothetical protein SAMN05892883_3085 [Jatrophihabitans sp. GAS493]
MLSWLGVILFAVVVLGFCGYEVHWKLSRLNSDVERLAVLGRQLNKLQNDFATTADRAAEIQATAHGTGAQSTIVHSTVAHSTAVTPTAG